MGRLNRKQRRSQAKSCSVPPPRTAAGLGEELLTEALAHHRSGRLAEADGLYRRLLDINPSHADALHLSGVIGHQTGLYEFAVERITLAIAQNDRVPDYYSNLGVALRAQGKMEEAAACYRRAIALRVDFASAHVNLSNVLKELGHLHEAVASAKRALVCQPDHGDAHNNLGNALMEQGELEEAAGSLGRAEIILPENSNALTNLALIQLYRPSIGLADILVRARRSSQDRVSQLPSPAVPCSPRAPRLGFVSADFRTHAVGLLVIPAIEGLARAGYHLTCYSNFDKGDHLTDRFVKAATVWRPVAGMPDEALADRIRADGIDILVDLSGYSAGNRLMAFARKPAPIQVGSWVGFPSTTGLAAMDYILGDQWQIPRGVEAYYSEAIVRFPDSYIAFEPAADAPPVTDLPAGANGFVTFGSFNVLKKITPRTVETWSRILKRLPTARLLMKSVFLGCPQTRRRFQSLFTANGIELERLAFLGRSSPGEHMATMSRADIALDSFPYSGGMTTLECLWMGLPVVTTPGETFASRHSFGYLSTAGLAEFVVSDVDRYVDLAVDLATDLPRLAKRRADMRRHLLNSPLCDVDRFVGHLDRALTIMWRRWCDGLPAQSFDIADETRHNSVQPVTANGMV